MKGIICYYSGSGNTKLAVKYIKGKISNVDFELCNIVRDEVPDLSKYDVVGFATFTDFGDAPQYMYSFFDRVSPQHNNYAFVFHTYGFLSGKTLPSLAKLAKSKNFKILCGHSLHTPESYPPMRSRNKTFDNSPNQRELRKFDEFIMQLDKMLATIQAGNKPGTKKIRISLPSVFFPAFSRTRAKMDFGEQQVDIDLCKECGTCKKLCPYEAIELAPNPVFDHSKCGGCWSCYNHCPEKAIYTYRFKGEWQYPKPSEELVNKLQLK